MTPASQLNVLAPELPGQPTKAVPSTSMFAPNPATAVCSDDVDSETIPTSAPSTGARFALDFSGKSTKNSFGSYKINEVFHARLLTIGIEHSLRELIHVLLRFPVAAGHKVTLFSETSFARYTGLVAATTDEELLQMARDIEQFFMDKKQSATLKAQKSLSIAIPTSPALNARRPDSSPAPDLEAFFPSSGLSNVGTDSLWGAGSGSTEPLDTYSYKPARLRRVSAPIKEVPLEELSPVTGLFPDEGLEYDDQVVRDLSIGDAAGELSEAEGGEGFGMVTSAAHIAYLRDVGFYTRIAPGVRAAEGDVPMLESVDGMWDYVVDDNPKLKKPGLPLDHQIAVIKKVAEGYKDLADNHSRTKELNRFFTKEHKAALNKVKHLSRIKKDNTPKSFACFPIQVSESGCLADLAAMSRGSVMSSPGSSAAMRGTAGCSAAMSASAGSSSASKETQEITALEQVEYLRAEGAGVYIAKDVLGRGKIFDLLCRIKTEKDGSRIPSVALYDALIDTCREEEHDLLQCFFIVEREQSKPRGASGSKKRKMPESSLFYRRNGLAGTEEGQEIYRSADELSKMSALRLPHDQDQQSDKSYQ